MGGYVGAGQKPIALFDAYTKGQADGLFPDKTSATPQDFAAMPSVGGDPVVESGSNADGEWTRWADGTQTCYQYEGSVRTLTGTRDGLYFLQTSKTFPAAFTGTPSVSPTGEDIGQGLYWATYYSPSSTTFGYEAIGTVASAAIVLGYTAIGRWK